MRFSAVVLNKMKRCSDEMFAARSSTRNRRCSGRSSGTAVFMRAKSISGGRRGLLPGQRVEQQQERAGHNGAVRQVERRPVMRAQIEIQEVGHLAVGEAVPQIAERAT